MRGVAIFSGNSHPELAVKICKHLSIPVGSSTLTKFSNRETNVNIDETVRGLDVFIVQSSCGNVNDNFIELLIMISACRTASAKKITAVIPCFPYARQPEQNYYSFPTSSSTAKNSSSSNSNSGSSNPPPSSTLSSASSNPRNYSTEGLAIATTPLPTRTIPNNPSSSVLDKQSSVTFMEPHSTLSSKPPGDPQSPTFEKGATSNNSGSSSVAAANRKRISSISTSQPNISVTSLTPPRPSKETTAYAAPANGYKKWTARPGTLIANTLMAAGCDHVMTMDLHDPQFQGYFDIPVDNIYSHPLIIKYIKEKIPNYREAIIVSPDAGGAKRATLIADKLQMDFALIHKERLHHGPRGSDMMLVGDVSKKLCVIIDDMSDTAETICAAAQTLMEKGGATKVLAIITHGIFSGQALDRINESVISEVIVTNTVPQDQHKEKCKKIRVMDVTSIFAEAIRRIHNGESVSFLADMVPY